VDRAPSYTLETLDDWIARVKARGHAMLEEQQLTCRIERYGNIAHLWSRYTLCGDEWRIRNILQSALSRPDDDRGAALPRGA